MTGSQQAERPSEEVVRWLERLELQQRGIDAGRLLLLAAAMREVLSGSAGPGRELAYRSLRAELALAFNLSERQVEGQMDLAYRVSEQYGAALETLERGEIACAHVRVIADAGAVIGAGDDPGLVERRAGYEAEVLDVARRETPNRLRPIARRLAERWAERPLEECHTEAVTRRRVCVVDGEDGMADLIATLPAVEAYAIHDRLTRIARAAGRGEREVPAIVASASAEDGPTSDGNPVSAGDGSATGDGPASGTDAASAGGSAGADAPRSRDQLRADAFADLLLCADEHTMFAGSPAEAIRARVQVVVPVEAFASGGGGVAAVSELQGYGPIDPGAARRLAREAPGWDRVCVDDASGEVLSVDRYRPSEQMRRLLGARDRTCRFPGCRVPVSRCDLDHTIDAALGGLTNTDNLAHLCRGHHTLKHHTAWTVAQEPGGALRWTSPIGRQYVDRPPGRADPPRGRADRSRSPDRADRSGAPSRTGQPGGSGERSRVRFVPAEQPEICF